MGDAVWPSVIDADVDDAIVVIDDHLRRITEIIDFDSESPEGLQFLAFVAALDAAQAQLDAVFLPEPIALLIARLVTRATPGSPAASAAVRSAVTSRHTCARPRDEPAGLA